MKEQNSSSPTKKRKSIDERTVTTDGAHDDVNTGHNNDGGVFPSSSYGRGDDGASLGSPSNNEQSIQQTLSQMNKIMMRMEEKLDTVCSTVSSLESRCEQLERKWRSTKEHIDKKFDSLHLDLDQKCDSLADRLEAKVDSARAQETDKALQRYEYNEMLIKNQRWEYSAPVLSMNELMYNGYTEDADEAEHIAMSARDLKRITTKMRRGEFSHERNGNDKGIELAMNDEDPPFNYAVNNELLPHWKVFANALKQFTPAINMLPENCESYFVFNSVQLNHDAMLLIKEALIGKPFQRLDFTHNNIGDGARGGMSVDAILDIVESNKYLRKLDIERNQIGPQHIERICSTVRNYPLVHLDLERSFEPGVGDQMLTALLTSTSGELKLESLDMSGNNITSAVSTLLSNFLATNPMLEILYLEDNDLNDSDAVLIANALRTNTILRNLDLEENNISDDGAEAFRLVLCDESSLNAAVDSNHFCNWRFDEYNYHEQWQINRGWKVYSLLSSRNETLSNMNDFGDIDVKMLPNMLEAVA